MYVVYKKPLYVLNSPGTEPGIYLYENNKDVIMSSYILFAGLSQRPIVKETERKHKFTTWHGAVQQSRITWHRNKSR